LDRQTLLREQLIDLRQYIVIINQLISLEHKAAKSSKDYHIETSEQLRNGLLDSIDPQR
jgi:hypothetical protein